MTFNGNRYRYHCMLMLNPLQRSGCCTCRQGQNLPLFSSHISFVCSYVALNQQQIYPYTVFTDCISNGGTLYSRWGKQRLYYRWQKPEASVHSNALVTHGVPFPKPCRAAKGFECIFPIWFIFQYQREWNKNGKIKTLRQASVSVTGSDRLDWKRQQQFYFS
jgi:hypothetical protein